MSSVWTRLEPHLAGWPSRPGTSARARRAASRGGAVGGVVAAHLPRHLRDRAPNQGLADPHEILNERPDATAERSCHPRGDLGGGCAASASLLFSVDTHRPAHEFDISPSTCRPSRPTQPAQLRRPGRRPGAAAERRPEHRWRRRCGHCTYNPEPLADFPTSRSSATARRSCPRSRRWSGSGRRRVAPSPAARPSCRSCPAAEGCMPSMAEVAYEGRHIRRSRPATPTSPSGSRSARSPTSTHPPAPPARPAHRGGPRPAERRGVPGCTGAAGSARRA